jgi:hypothetical protein
MAGLFLLLLYTAPSALLVYWTGNNALMLVENLWKRYAPDIVIFRDSGAVFGPQSSLMRRAFPADASSIRPGPRMHAFLLAAGVLLFTVVPGARASAGQTQGVLAAALCFALAAGVAVVSLVYCVREEKGFFARRVKPALLFGLLAYAGCRLAALCFAARSGDAYDSAFDACALLAVAAVALPLTRNGLRRLIRAHLATGHEQAIFFASALCLGVLAGVYAPGELYASSPAFFPKSLLESLFALLPYIVAFLMLCFMLWLMLPGGLRPVAGCVFFAAALIALLNATFFTGDFGALDGAVLANPEGLSSWRSALADGLALAIAVMATVCVYRFRRAPLAVLCLLATAATLGCMGAYPGIGEPEKLRPAIADDMGDPGKDGFFVFSGDKPNVLVVILDMFTGGHMEELLEENPELAQRFRGFTWYPDTVAAGSSTALSISGIYGGPAYDAQAMDARPEETLLAKYTEALYAMPEAMAKRGYANAFLHLPFTPDADVAARLDKDIPLAVTHRLPEAGLQSRWLAHLHETDDADVKAVDFSRYMLFVGLFRAAPNPLRSWLYNDGVWRFDLTGDLDQLNVPNVFYESAILGLLPQFAATGAPGPTFKVLYSMLPHSAWHLPRDGLMPVRDPYPETEGQNFTVDGVLPEHVYTERHTLAFLADFFDWLRRERIYDNTRIILVSDHCDGDSRMLKDALGFRDRGKKPLHSPETKPFDRPHALLMVKDFGGGDKPLALSWELMRSSDVPWLATRGIGGEDAFPAPDTGPSRVRAHARGSWRQFEIPGKRTFDPDPPATVTGTMFARKNWSFGK